MTYTTTDKIVALAKTAVQSQSDSETAAHKATRDLSALSAEVTAQGGTTQDTIEEYVSAGGKRYTPGRISQAIAQTSALNVLPVGTSLKDVQTIHSAMNTAGKAKAFTDSVEANKANSLANDQDEAENVAKLVTETASDSREARRIATAKGKKSAAATREAKAAAGSKNQHKMNLIIADVRALVATHTVSDADKATLKALLGL